MISSKRFTKEEIASLKKLFEKYKEDEKFTLNDIAKKLQRNSTGISKRLKKIFGEEYSKIARNKIGTYKRKVSNEEVKELFLLYKRGKSAEELAKSVDLKAPPLRIRMKKLLGKKYEVVAKRKLKDKRKIQKVEDKKIKELFELYKTSKVSLNKLAKTVDINHETLRYRFEKLFNKEYRKFGRIKQYGRKITHDIYRKAFEEYKSTDISLLELAKKLGISFETIREFFIKKYGEKYREIAQQKYDASEAREKGKLAEYLALSYLKLIGLNPIDVRNKHILNGTLKRPDFIAGDMFIEVKNSYLRMKSSGNRKGYAEIVSTYLGKKLKLNNKILTKGMIIAISGFSPDVKEQARKDGIKLVGLENIKQVFKEIQESA